MRYFTYMAEQAFKTSASGERLFYRGGPWSRPYIVPDAATEQKLYRKNVWQLRVLLGGLLVGQPFLFRLFPKVLHDTYWFLVYAVVVTMVFWLTRRIVFAGDLKGLQRAQARLSPRLFYGEMARRHSGTALALGLVVCLLFVACGIWILSLGMNYAIGVGCIVFFGLCAVAWGYALYLKLARHDDIGP